VYARSPRFGHAVSPFEVPFGTSTPILPSEVYKHEERNAYRIVTFRSMCSACRGQLPVSCAMRLPVFGRVLFL
jgi:hypothetical protein